jgi:hypothetical protein
MSEADPKHTDRLQTIISYDRVVSSVSLRKVELLDLEQLVLDAGRIAVSAFGYITRLKTRAHLVHRNLTHLPNCTRWMVGYSGACVTGLRLHGMTLDSPQKRETRRFEAYKGQYVNSMYNLHINKYTY